MSANAPAPSSRCNVAPFHAMDVLAKANALEAAGRKIVHMEVGQPGAPAPAPVLEAARRVLDIGQVRYTEALGILPLRERIAVHYRDAYGIDVPVDRIAITTGSSAAFNLAFLAGFDVGDRVALPTPGYPAYRNILAALGLEAVEIETTAESRWALTPEMIRAAHAERPLKGVLVASPANPTGTMVQPDALKALTDVCRELGIWFISDEIYHGLVYEGRAETALALSDEAIVINSFSKYYCMTGWRVGWMVVPERLVRPIERLGQNLYLSVPELSQRAAVAAFDATDALEAIKEGYAANRRLLLNRLPEIGFDELLPVDGAFYVYGSVRRFSNDSMDFAQKMLLEAGVAASPGVDFDPVGGHNYLRFSFAGTTEAIAEGCDRLQNWLK
ncbi:aspartate/methionine/tyrosine aminotransferase [Rhodobium orientis]|uniref:aspartate transaminase n=1 Tax=Rhodobium orientis TaxID=34017 RepID=A0A327JU96_9HYPH|nr:pyridoxal phosphate-dependent aminotransferase [Rhodobium orientis]MBB4302642.1 aspartate/methionine/tyrosine aminotransferase [Rhodobium orientis]MBK5951488.1 1-aminocyclopropane-1-carboxylate deaminase [Rhodobium orientis]RAI29086.1 1-aminocyclopropane-1-carboxylate deaminase [Rhodobium orientis]